MPRPSNASIRALAAVPVLAALLLTGACAGGGEGSAGDTAGATAAAATPAAGDTTGTMAGMDHSNMPGMASRPPAKDADHEFLRMMSDHHAGLVQMASAAMTKASKPETQTDAHNLHTKQEEEQKRMVSMVQQSYGESVTPVVMPDNKAMNDSLQTKTGTQYDRTFYANVIKHHQQGVEMVDRFLPRLRKAEVRQMAEKMKAEQQREITQFQQKMARL